MPQLTCISATACGISLALNEVKDMLLKSPDCPRRVRRGSCIKVMLIGMVVVVVLAAFMSSQHQKAQQEALTAADAAYASKPAEAVARYKIGYPSAGSRKAEVLQRIVDHEAEGNPAEATRWIEKGLDEQIAVTYKAAASRTLVAKVEKDRADREATRKAAEVAKQDERDTKAKERDTKSRTYTRDEFKALVEGKTRNEVIALLGKPKSTQQSGELEVWDYPGRTTDPVTGKTDHLATVEFEGDRVANVTFIRV